ncbi:hypothetical protein H0H81_011894 [Sphagnurus paluster]|uniref:Uncharacterized protein n=1 Tax=Sphagnurus paluster TaxID=117069 RepID=A0A9P7FNH8_9AGAR|nr:hypothetical protein H0H81_011894 [Sphagnurus paluster]
MGLAGFNPRSLSAKILFLGTSFTFLLFLYLYTNPAGFLSSIKFPSGSGFNFERIPGRCPPRAYANGRWTGPHYRTHNASVMTDKAQALAFAGFTGCASSREFDWHLAADNVEQYPRFPNAQSYTWDVGPSDGCEGFEPLDKARVVRDMVQQGGWLLLGDSITEGHFFSLSCVLHPHVIATPVYTPNSYFDRAWPQNLYLNPDSPLLQEKHFALPPGFNITGTPLATFRRVDLLFTQDNLTRLHATLHPSTAANASFALFSSEAAWSLSPKEYLPLFFDGGYSTMVVSTGGHWTTTLFGGAYAQDAPAPARTARQGLDGVVDFFAQAMQRWADEVQSALAEAERMDRGARKRQVLVRAYLPGHDDCHNILDPWTEVHTPKGASYNWGSIWRYNEVFENLLSGSGAQKKYPDLHYLAIERPGRLRPDAHTTGDCLHIMAGAGVMEGWSHYIWHYVSNELGRGRHSRVNTAAAAR